MASKNPSQVSVKTLKALLRLAEENELQLLEFNSVKILRGGPRTRADRKEASKQVVDAKTGFEDLPETVEQMDERLRAQLQKVM